MLIVLLVIVVVVLFLTGIRIVRPTHRGSLSGWDAIRTDPRCSGSCGFPA
jgi:hypothetical protein